MWTSLRRAAHCRREQVNADVERPFRQLNKVSAWPGPGLNGSRHKLTLACTDISLKVSFSAPHPNYTAGHQLTTANGRKVAARLVEAAPEHLQTDHQNAASPRAPKQGARHSLRTCGLSTSGDNQAHRDLARVRSHEPSEPLTSRGICTLPLCVELLRRHVGDRHHSSAPELQTAIGRIGLTLELDVFASQVLTPPGINMTLLGTSGDAPAFRRSPGRTVVAMRVAGEGGAVSILVRHFLGGSPLRACPRQQRYLPTAVAEVALLRPPRPYPSLGS